MIVGEALNRRADLKKRIAQLQERIRANALGQEGELPAEDVAELIAEYAASCDELETLIARINHANAEARLPTGETVTEALARRDVIGLRAAGLRGAVDSATERGPFSFRRSEGRVVRHVAVKEVRAEIDRLARERRELDTLIQRHNWTVTLTS